MSPRIKLRAAATPLVMAGALWATSALTPLAFGGGGAQTPPPCGPDGVCVPRPETYGWYQTRWRTFPGDVAFKAPTPAPGAEGPQPENLGGPQLPTPAQEGLLGPARQRPAGEGGAAGAEGAEGAEEDAAGAGLGAMPGEAPLPGFQLPSATTPPPAGDQPPATEGAEGAAPAEAPATPPQPGPGAEPAADPLDPFGGAPPTPPHWISRAAIQQAELNGSSVDALPIVEHASSPASFESEADVPVDVAAPGSEVSQSIYMPSATETFEAAPQLPPMDGPNLHGDDAPPVLPPALLGSVAGGKSAVRPAASSQPSVRQPASVQPIVDRRVKAASAESPMGIQLINPAAALVDPAAQGLQQAIYFEASDQ